MVTVTEINYRNFGKCVKLDNGTASIMITVEVGPRIISYCLNGHAVRKATRTAMSRTMIRSIMRYLTGKVPPAA